MHNSCFYCFFFLPTKSGMSSVVWPHCVTSAGGPVTANSIPIAQEAVASFSPLRDWILFHFCCFTLSFHFRHKVVHMTNGESYLVSLLPVCKAENSYRPENRIVAHFLLLPREPKNSCLGRRRRWTIGLASYSHLQLKQTGLPETCKHLLFSYQHSLAYDSLRIAKLLWYNTSYTIFIDLINQQSTLAAAGAKQASRHPTNTHGRAGGQNGERERERALAGGCGAARRYKGRVLNREGNAPEM